MHGLRERIQELEAQMNVMRDELENKHLEGSASTLREKYQKDFENLKVLPRFVLYGISHRAFGPRVCLV